AVGDPRDGGVHGRVDDRPAVDARHAAPDRVRPRRPGPDRPARRRHRLGPARHLDLRGAGPGGLPLSRAGLPGGDRGRGRPRRPQCRQRGGGGRLPRRAPVLAGNRRRRRRGARRAPYGKGLHRGGRCRGRWRSAPARRGGRGPEERRVKSPTLDELAESERASAEVPEGGGRRAATTALLLVIAMAVLAYFRPQLAGTIGVLAAIVLMIMLHELGHFVMAKRAGMKVTEYFLGFGPRLWSFRRGETEYGVKAIPAGGYVRIIGMSNLDVVEPEDEERTYRSKPYHDRLGVAVAGSTMHFIIAYLLLLAVYALVGIPAARPIIQQIVPDSPAQHSEFRVGDRIVAINGIRMKGWEDIPTYVESHGESELVFTVIHKGSSQPTDVALKPRAETVDGKQVPRVGIGPEQYLQTKPLPSAVVTTTPTCRSSCGRRSRPSAGSSPP